jgi:hypothetical protein
LAQVIAFPPYIDLKSKIALECYYENVPEFNEGRPAAARQLNKLMNIAKINRAFGVASDDNTRTIQCPAGYHYCAALHCQKVFSKFNALLQFREY